MQFWQKRISKQSLTPPRFAVEELNPNGWSVHTFFFFASNSDEQKAWAYVLNVVCGRPTVDGLFVSTDPSDVVYYSVSEFHEGQYQSQTKLFKRDNFINRRGELSSVEAGFSLCREGNEYCLKMQKNDGEHQLVFSLKNYHYWCDLHPLYQHYTGFGSFTLNGKISGRVMAERGAGLSLPVNAPFRFFNYTIVASRSGLDVGLKVHGPLGVELNNQSLSWCAEKNQFLQNVAKSHYSHTVGQESFNKSALHSFGAMKSHIWCDLDKLRYRECFDLLAKIKQH